ncbi:methyltransferase [Candidatus Woesearchaeota archaeon]|nr:methyltransferase [Candidatus Woesearchaeota archaeon]
MIYEPAEDSYLLEEQVRKYVKKGMKVLDVGTGSGIQAEAAKEAKILALDINQECVDFVRKKGINCVKSDLFEKINEKFDLIIFNPPYLPEDEEEPEDSKLLTTGGKKGNEILIRFFSQVKKYLNKDGKILIVFSSLTPDVDKIIRKYGFKYKKLSEQKIPFETLYVYLVEQ